MSKQFGFMPGWSTKDPVFALRQLMERYREIKKDINMVFIDFLFNNFFKCSSFTSAYHFLRF